MSKIGNKLITIPDQVDVEIENHQVSISGPLGNLKITTLQGIKIQKNDSVIAVTRNHDDPKTRGFHGLLRALINNAITGVSTGFVKKLDLKGVGYRAEIQDNNLILHVGYSHPVSVVVPQNIKAALEKNTIIITGIDKQQVGQFAGSLRAIRPPEPYKGKGIRYSDEIVKLKPGKQAAKVGGAA